MSKKTLVSAITAALVVGAASTTFAANNPFSDVPADSWAYDAVSTLAADGVIDGYPDVTVMLMLQVMLLVKSLVKNTMIMTLAK